MDGPAADLDMVSRRGSEEGILKAAYSGLDIVGACFPFLFLREYVGCEGGAGAAAGWGGCWSGTFALFERLVEGVCSGATSKSAVALRLRGSDRRGAGGGGAGSVGDPAAEAPADRDGSACLAAWRADERVAGLLDEDMSKELTRDHHLMQVSKSLDSFKGRPSCEANAVKESQWRRKGTVGEGQRRRGFV